MQPLTIAQIILFAKDMPRMVAFYGETLGLPRIASPDDPAEFVRFDAGGLRLALHRIPEPIARDIRIADPPRARSETPLKFAFGVADVQATRDRLRSRGVQLGSVQRFGELQLCDGLDPEGNVFQLSNRP